MKLAYIANASIPSRTAASIHVMQMCEAFAKIGHEVLLLVPDGSDQGISDGDPFRFYGVQPCFSLERLSRGRGSVAYGYRAARRARQWSPDLVYGRFVTGCFFAAVLGLDVVWESHAPLRDLSFGARHAVSALVLSRFRRIVVISDALKDCYATQWGISPSRLFVAPDAASPPQLEERLTFTNSANLQVGYIGHLYPGKGMELIVQLVPRCPWAHFHIVGGMPEDIERWKSRLGGMANVTFYGFLPYPKTNRYRQSFDVVLAPYQATVHGHATKWRKSAQNISRWMSPLKIFEYMAAGRPIVASNLSVIREVLEDGRNAILCDPTNVGEWVQALERLRDDRQLGERLASAGSSDFLSRFTWRARAAEVLAASLGPREVKCA